MDAGYGGEENYAYLESEQLEAIVKYSTYHQEKSKKWQQDISKLQLAVRQSRGYMDVCGWSETAVSL